MKSFLEIIKEEETTHKPVVMAFGRMNPPTTGHLKVIDKVKELAHKNKAKHVVIVSHTQDSKKNPLSGEQKVKHVRRYSPGTNVISSSKETPSFIDQAKKLHAAGHDHLIMVAGSDRVKEFHDILHKYNGPGKSFNFKKIEVRSAGHRDPDSEGAEGMSGTKMRQHAKNNDFSSFRQGIPSHVSDEHAREIMHDTRKGMGLHEDVNRGRYKAIFVTGGPGSGKDIVIREAIAESKIVEMNFEQVIAILNDKNKFVNSKFEAIRSRGPLIINGPADDYDSINTIKEHLEAIGYDTMMIFVHTSNEISKERNLNLKRMVSESVRKDKWNICQKNMKQFENQFENFYVFDNSVEIEMIEESISEIYQKNNEFLDTNESNFSDKLKQSLKENNSPYMQLAMKAGKIDDVRDGDVKSNSSYTFRAYNESKPKLKVNPAPKEPNFNMDKDKIAKLKAKGFKDSPTQNARLRNIATIGQEYDTRQQGTVYPMSGLGDVTYREQKQFKKFRKEAIDSPSSDMGVGGTLGGSTNTEPLVTPLDKYGMAGITIKKRKK
jgi:cytidyltransferase-like protein